MTSLLLALLSSWHLSLGFGSAYSVPAPLTIRQAGEQDIRFTARFATKPFAEVPYYAVRIGRDAGPGAWEFELLHHKLYLANPPVQVQRFQMSHGYNFLLLNRMWRLSALDLRAGIGVVMPHPENTVRGLRLDEGGGTLGTGWYFCGPGAQVALAREMEFGRWSVGFEGKLTAAWTRVPVAHGSADLANVALHLLLVSGHQFGR